MAVTFLTKTLGARLGTKRKKGYILSYFYNEVNIGYKTFSSITTRVSPGNTDPSEPTG